MTVQNLLIGVDVGGTNTDSVLLNPLLNDTENRGILGWHKAATTADVSVGIFKAIESLFKQCPTVKPSDIRSVTIGTTHFINAVIEQDKGRLQPVAVLRLCGPYSRSTPPFIDFPESLKSIMMGYVGFLDGGYRVDGQAIKQLDENEILKHAKEIAARNIKCIVVQGIFSPLMADQEENVATLLRQHIPGVRVVKSHTIANLGYLERENAAILNASILPFAEKIVASFQSAVRKLGITAPVMITQNDGTVLSASAAAKTPIRTFSSGATNSMRGAAFLCSADPDLSNTQIMVIDIGGTTTDVGILLKNGFPRQAAAYTTVGGVRMNFPMPHVESIGLGGGSIVREHDNGSLTIGPDSVGCEILQRALICGGDTTTTTDVTVAFDNQETSMGKASLVRDKFDEKFRQKYERRLKLVLESIIDRMKTSSDPLPVLLVGGGSMIAPKDLEGASKVILPPFFSVANAIGAATALVSSSIDVIETIPEGKTSEDVLNHIKAKALASALKDGAMASSLQIAEVDVVPLPYVANRARFLVKAVGELDHNAISSRSSDFIMEDDLANGGEIVKESHISFVEDSQTADSNGKANHSSAISASAYRPYVNDKREWIISETDLAFISIGNYILGTGGGGSPYFAFLRIREMVRRGAIIRVVDLEDYKNEAQSVGEDYGVVTIGGAGTPTVSIEQFPADDFLDAYGALLKVIGKKPTAAIALEIGGGNGLQGMYLAGVEGLDLKCVDADFMGRAYPTLWQSTPYIYNTKSVYAPSAFSDGNGNTCLILESTDDVTVEKITRASLSEMGSHVGTVAAPMKATDTFDWAVLNTISMAWRVGRAIRIAQESGEIDSASRLIIDAVGGDESAKEVFRGKIIGVERRLFRGHSYGEVVIEPISMGQDGEQIMDNQKPSTIAKIPFKNENLYVMEEDVSTGEKKLLASVPDLICIIDAQSGEAVGCPEYRYGLTVFVIAIACSDKWTSSERALEIGGPAGFGLDIEYKPIGKFTKPQSVIEEFAI